jgi:hypothetical protein
MSGSEPALGDPRFRFDRINPVRSSVMKEQDKFDPWGDPAFEQAVRESAYFLWEQDGRPEGREHEYWYRALERNLRQRNGGETLPPGVHGAEHRQPMGDHNRRLALGVDIEQFAAEAGVSPDALRAYELTPAGSDFDLAVAGRVGAALDRLEANPPVTQKVAN